MSSSSRSVKIGIDALKLIGNPRFLAPCVAGAFMLVVGTILGVMYLFNMAAVLFAVPVASYILAVLSLRGLRVSTRPLNSVVEGQNVQLGVKIISTGAAPRLRLRLREVLPDQLKTVDSDSVDLALCTNGAIDVHYPALAAKRGVYQIGPIQLIGKDPIGIFECTRSYEGKRELVVYPRTQAVSLKLPVGGERFKSGETGASGRKGRSMEFHGVRDYVSGDEYRRIHWKSTARRGSLVVTEYEQGVASSIVIAIEQKKGTEVKAEDGTSLDTSARITAYVLEKALAAGIQVTLLSSARSEINSQQALVVEDKNRILESLARLSADSSLSLADVLNGADISSEHMVIAITPNPDEGLVRELQELAVKGSVVNLVLVPGKQDAVSSELISSLESAGVSVTVADGAKSNG